MTGVFVAAGRTNAALEPMWANLPGKAGNPHHTR